MRKSWLLVSAGVVAVGGTAGALSLNQPASAASGLRAGSAQLRSKADWGHHRGWGGPFMRQALGDVATALNISPATLQSDLQAGDSIASIAQTNNVNLTTLEGTLLTDAKNAIQGAVTAGHLSQAQATKIEAHLSSRIDAMVTHSPRQFMRRQMRGPGMMGLARGLMADAASVLKISPTTLQSDLRSGESLATIAQNNHSSASALVIALVSAATSKLQGAVSSDKLTQAQATKIEGGLTQRITTLVNQTPPLLPPGHRFGAVAMGSLINDAATALNMPVSTLQSDLMSGKSLAAIAGPSRVSSLESALVQDASTAIQSAVKSGQVNSAMATKIESHLPQMIDRFVTGTGHPGGPDGWGPPPNPGH